MLSLFLPVLDTTIVNVALPYMMGSLDTNQDEVRWVVTAYSMAFAVVTLASSWARTFFGIKNLYLASIFLFVLSSFLCGISPNLNVMILCRVLQAVGGGMMMPLGFTIITEAFSPQDRPKAFGFFGIVIVLGPTIGPILGGWLVDNFNWRDVFFINIPFGILSFFFTFLVLKKDRTHVLVPFDFAGFLSLGAALSFLLVGLTEGERWGWTSRFVYECWGVAAIAFWIYVMSAFMVRHPIIHLGIFRDLDFSLIMLANFFRALGLFGRMFLLPLFVQTFNLFTATDAGLVLLPSSLMAGVTMPILGNLSSKGSDRFKRILLVSGFLLLAISQFLFAFLMGIPSMFQILLAQLIFGLSMGMLNALLSSIPQTLVEPRFIGQASSLQSNMLQIGGALGVAILGNVLDHREASFYNQYQSDVTRHSYTYQRVLDFFYQSVGHGSSSTEMTAKAGAMLINSARNQAAISAYNETFVVAGMLALLGIPMILLMRRLSQKGKGETISGKGKQRLLTEVSSEKV
jgi:DHA2 family multidrug resistance protein